MPHSARILAWLDDKSLLPSAYVQGCLFGGTTLGSRDAFWNGTIKKGGWWYYFPAAFLVKTPSVLLVLLVVGLVIGLTRYRQRWRNAVFFLIPPALFLVNAMNWPLNIGLRYILMVYPFVILIAALPLAEAWKRGWRWCAPLCLFMSACELGFAYPDTLAFFNAFAGGPTNGYRYLVDSNLDWGQDLKGLKQWMDANQVKHINLSYFGTADPEYYHIDCDYITHTTDYPGKTSITLPGYVAVSATYLWGVYFADADRDYFAPLRKQTPVAVIGHSIFVYWVDEKWW